MREFTAPASFRAPTTGSLTDAVLANADEHGAEAAFSRPVDGDWRDVTWAEFLADVTAAGRGLLSRGVRAGDRVALMSRTRYEWVVVDYAIWFVGAVTVPIYETASAEQVDWVLADSAAVLAIVETAEHRLRLAPVVDHAVRLGVVTIDDGGLADLAAAGTAIDPADLEARRAQVVPESLATLIYTSGTTGRPKGCRLTHANFLFEIAVTTSALHDLFEVPDAGTVLFLPMPHVFARVISIGCVQARVKVRHASQLNQLLADLTDFGPTFVLAVPRVFENLFHTVSARAVSDGRGRQFEAAVSTAVAYSRAMDRGRPGLLLRGRHAMFERTVYKHLRAALGGRLRYAVSGGAPLGERLAHFYRGLGIPVLEGYGLTETTAAVTANLPGAQRIGTVGRPLPGTTVRVSPDGELLVRGGQVFSGYWSDDDNRDALVDGWLHTGDVGDLDDSGYLRVAGRKHEILVTAGGKNVAPAVLEDRLRTHPLVGHCMVVGDGRPFVAALVTLDPHGLAGWQSTHHRPGSLPELASDPELLAEMQSAVDQANEAVSQAEAIRRFAILDVVWSEATGELTPTSKVKRQVVLRRFHDAVEALYA